MKRHGMDPLTLVSGLLFLMVGAAYLIAELTDSEVDARWVIPVVFVTVGFAGLASSLLNVLRRRDESPPSDV
jgi:O-antigen/teichoic acid export membrane protein